jgi:Bacterial Ig-like domain (group 3)/Putative Ig domain
MRQLLTFNAHRSGRQRGPRMALGAAWILVAALLIALTCGASVAAAEEPLPETATEVSVSPSTTLFGGSVRYSATVTSSDLATPTGAVTFTSGATTICTTGELVNGEGSCSATNAPVGSDTITGTYSGSSEFASSFGTTTLTVESKPAITSANKALFTEGTAGSFTPTATGYPAPTISITGGSPPSGVTFSGGVLSGTPTQQGTFTITFTASNSAGSTSQTFTLTVDAPPAITSANSTTFEQGVAGTFTVTATGTPAPTITKWGNLPPGVSFAKGVLSGTPTQEGSFQVTFTASNSFGSSSQDFTLTVLGLRFTISSLPEATIGEAYSAQLTATAGQPPYKWAVTGGALPTGLKLNKKTGLISGTPKKTARTKEFQVTVTDSSKTDPQSAAAVFTIVVNT